MFPPKKTDPTQARRELQRNASIFLVAVLAIRLTPYALHFLQKA